MPSVVTWIHTKEPLSRSLGRMRSLNSSSASSVDSEVLRALKDPPNVYIKMAVTAKRTGTLRSSRRRK